MAELGTAQVIRGDARDLPLADNSVDLVVTSPPYFALRSYQDGGEHYAGQVGSEPTPGEFLDSLMEVMRESVRVVKPSGSIFVNLGDKYSGAQAQNIGGANRAGDSARTWAQTNPKRTGIPNKSLMLIPERFRIRCVDELGLIARAVIVWSKPNGLPESVTDRVRRSHEDWVHFTLEPRYFSAVDEIREAHARSWGGTPNGGGYYRDELAPGQKDANLPNALPNPLGKLPGSVWTVPTEPLRVPDHLGIDHFAAFPTEWPRRIIQGWSPAGVCVACGEGRRPVASSPGQGGERSKRDGYLNAWGSLGESSVLRMTGTSYAKFRDENPRTITGYACACPTPDAPTRPAVVLDPFGGTGTTALVAKALGRHGITIDMSADYCRLAAWRTNDRDHLAKVLGIAKAEQQDDGQELLFDMDAEPRPPRLSTLQKADRDCPTCNYRTQYTVKPGRPCEKCGVTRQETA